MAVVGSFCMKNHWYSCHRVDVRSWAVNFSEFRQLTASIMSCQDVSELIDLGLSSLLLYYFTPQWNFEERSFALYNLGLWNSDRKKCEFLGALSIGLLAWITFLWGAFEKSKLAMLQSSHNSTNTSLFFLALKCILGN